MISKIDFMASFFFGALVGGLFTMFGIMGFCNV